MAFVRADSDRWKVVPFGEIFINPSDSKHVMELLGCSDGLGMVLRLVCSVETRLMGSSELGQVGVTGPSIPVGRAQAQFGTREPALIYAPRGTQNETTSWPPKPH